MATKGQQGKKRRAKADERRAVAHLFDHELIVVTGKGGVGKTTVAAALGSPPRGGQAHDRRRGRARDDVRARSGAGSEPSRKSSSRRGLSHLGRPARRARDYLETSSRRGRCRPAHPSRASPARGRDAGPARAAHVGKLWELAQLTRRPSGALRPRGPRRARDGPRHRGADGAAHLCPPPGSGRRAAGDDRCAVRTGADGGRRGGTRRGAADERDA